MITKRSHAINRCAEIYEHWKTCPPNYPPPPGSHESLAHEHHTRWISSQEYAHCQQILRIAEQDDE
jgi:hypothetical protein